MSDSEKAISKYLAEVKRQLPYTRKMRKTLIQELRDNIGELDTGDTRITYEFLVTEIGTPDEVARSFEDRKSIAAFKKRSRRYGKAKVILACCAVLLIFAVVITVGVVLENEGYYSRINALIDNIEYGREFI